MIDAAHNEDRDLRDNLAELNEMEREKHRQDVFSHVSSGER
jgi:hypothetical protein